jgi:translocation and assembly module TamA
MGFVIFEGFNKERHPNAGRKNKMLYWKLNDGDAVLLKLFVILPGRAWRVASNLLICGGVCLGLSGCAALQFWKKKDDADAETQTQPQQRLYQLELKAPGPLNKLLDQYLDLARFQFAPVGETITPAELNRLAALAPAQAKSLLETEGYFNANVQVQRVGPADAEIALLRLTVDPGPRTKITQTRFDAQGDLADRAQREEPQALELIETSRKSLRRLESKDFTQTLWSQAKTTTLAQMRLDGYLTANWQETDAEVDADKNQARLTLAADSGPLFHFGEIQIDGLRRFEASSITNLRTFNVGDPLYDKTLNQFQDRLRKLGLYESVAIEVDPDPAKAQAATVTVRVREAALHQATVGVGYSDRTGQGLTVEYLHRRFFNRPWISKNAFRLSRDEQYYRGELRSYPLEKGYQNLAAVNFSRQDINKEITTETRVRLGRVVESERIERFVFAEGTSSSVRNILGYRSTQSLSGNFHFNWRDVDSMLLPTEGLTINWESAAGAARSRALDSGGFGRVYTNLRYYRPLGSTWYGQARFEVGQVFAKKSVGIPNSMLFRAGGDDSVRGYPTESLGPLVNGTAVSARHLMTGSLEVARPISPRFAAVWGAVFVDAGNAANSWGEWKPALGYGVGLRYRSPVGSLRLDLAHGQDIRSNRVHLSVDVALK